MPRPNITEKIKENKTKRGKKFKGKTFLNTNSKFSKFIGFNKYMNVVMYICMYLYIYAFNMNENILSFFSVLVFILVKESSLLRFL